MAAHRQCHNEKHGEAVRRQSGNHPHCMTGNEAAALEISRLDHRKPAVADDLRRLMARAYAVEAGLIRAVEFPPLDRTAEAIRAADAVFDGGSLAGRLVAAVELEATGERSVHIASFVVDPEA